jgi:cell division protein FtsQ
MSRRALFLKRACIVVFLTASLFGLGVFYQQINQINLMPSFPIVKITVNKTPRVNELWLSEQLKPYLGQNLLTLAIEQMVHELKANPWVKSASVRRKWPNQVFVKIDTYQPIAQWNQTAYIADKNYLIETTLLNELSDLPLLEGPPDQREVVWQAYKDLSQISRKVELPITRLTFTPWGCWRVTLAKKIEVVLGKTDTHSRLERFIMAYNTLEKLRTTENMVYVDLRYNNGLTIAWHSN